MPSWGMIVEPKKKYKQKVQNSYRITQAVLDQSTAGKGHSDLLVTIDNGTYILATLSSSIPQCPLNMDLSKNDVISFSTRGEGTIHLTGYLVTPHSDKRAAMAPGGDAKENNVQQKKKNTIKTLANLMDKTLSEDDDDEDDASFNFLDGIGSDEEGEEEEDADSEDDDNSDLPEDSDDEDDDDLGEMDSDEEGEEEESGEEEEDDDEDEEEEIMPPSSKKFKVDKAQQQQQQQQKKQQQQQQQQQQKDQKQKKNKNEKPQENGVAKAPATTNAVNNKQQTLNGGVKIKDLKEGTGPFAKPGKKVAVYYEGRLQSNNKVFDSSKSGAGFKFQLGRGEVIRGWDIGVAGMRVGGKRQIVCPPNAAYGQKGSPPVIPPNSTLVFDVEVKSVS